MASFVSIRTRILERGKLQELRPGLALKILSITGKVIFLIFVVPGLLPGELAQYMFLMTVSLLSARLLGLGIEDELPLLVRGDRAVAQGHLRLYFWLIAVALTFLAVAMTLNIQLLYLGFLAVTFVAQFLLSGAVRSIRPLGYEILTNVNWVIFPGLCIFSGAKTANTLIATMGISLTINHLLVFYISRIRPAIAPVSRRQFFDILFRVRHGWRKCLSNFIDLANMRSLVVWPKLSRNPIGLDEIAFALAFGEIFWQFFMVAVQRRYARYCLQLDAPREKFKDAIVSGISLVGISGVVAAVVLIFDARLTDLYAIAWHRFAPVSIMFGFSAAYFLLRYSVWTEISFSWRLLANEAVLLVLIAIFLSVSPMWMWMWGVTALFACLYLTGVVIGARICQNMRRNQSILRP